MTEFVTAVTTDEIKPGERLVVGIDDVWIVIFNIDGAYYAVEDMCTHEEYELSGGALDGYTLECPKHGACYDVRSGAVLAPPALIPVRTFEVRVVGDEVQIARPS